MGGSGFAMSVVGLLLRTISDLLRFSIGNLSGWFRALKLGSGDGKFGSDSESCELHLIERSRFDVICNGFVKIG